ncbi:MAG: thermonuclease family protein [Alphaproteobacteria bacterium]
MRLIAILAVAAAFMPFGPADAAELVGRPRIVDGDTFAFRDDKVRLHGIDAPENAQHCRDAAGGDYRCGEAATKALETLVAGREIRCSGTDRDKYGRLIAVCRVGGREINRWMVGAGWAVAYLRYSRDYAAEERDAAQARRGLWAGSFEAPWEFRHARRTAAVSATPVPGCPVKGNISANGRIYHTPDSRWYDQTAIDPSKGERWFCSEREALDAGWRAPRG